MGTGVLFVLWLFAIVCVSAIQPLMRQSCAQIKIQPNTPRSQVLQSQLELDCTGTFKGRGIIAVQEVFYGQATSCEDSFKQWRCIRDHTDGAEEILAGNGVGYHSVSVKPRRAEWCPEPSTHVLVRYSCHDERELRDVCEHFALRTRGVVDLVSPSYLYPVDTAPATCVCNATVKLGSRMQATLLDLDLVRDTAGTCVEEIFNGSLEDHTDIWEILYNTPGACGRNDLPRNITLPKSTWSFVYSSHGSGTVGFTQRRGVWFQLSGMSRFDNEPTQMEVTCGPLTEPWYPPSQSGSGAIPTTRDPTTLTPTTRRPTSTRDPNTVPVDSNSDGYIGVIAGVAVGGFLVLVLFAVIVFICLRRKSIRDRQDMESKLAKLPPAAPTLPARNSPRIASVQSRTSSCPEYFEPIGDDDDIYCTPEDVQSEAAPYATLDGNVNPAYQYMNSSGSAYENKRTLTKEVSAEYDTVGGFSDYENARLAAEKKTSEYCHLPGGGEQAATGREYEKLAIGGKK